MRDIRERSRASRACEHMGEKGVAGVRERTTYLPARGLEHRSDELHIKVAELLPLNVDLVSRPKNKINM